MCEEVAGALAKCDNVENIIDLSGKSTIRQLIEGIRRSDLLISQETGALQIGVALRKPTVGILGGGHFGRFYPWANERINRIVNKQMDCYWCNWHCIFSTMKCIQDINPKLLAKQLRLALPKAKI
jgi:ADP-heptose:LPS heptosyltransferase